MKQNINPANSSSYNITEKKPYLNAPVFLLGAHKSGTSLLRALLDGHPQLVTFPKETHFFQYSGHWVDYAMRQARPAEHTQKSLLQSFCQYIEEQNSSIDPYSDNPEFGGYDLGRFISCFQQKEAMTLREQFELYMVSLHYALTGVHLPEGARIVEKSVENAEFAVLLRWMFPDSRFIHIVRNPYATIVSMRRAKSRRGYPAMANIARSLYNSSYYLFKNRTYMDNYKIIRYEDLLIDTGIVAREIAEFLEISYSDTLLKPTSLGVPWKGNSSNDTAFTGVSSAPLKNWQKHIKDYEIRLVNKVASEVIEHYGYERFEPKINKFIPIKRESIKAYFKNRVFLSIL